MLLMEGFGREADLRLVHDSRKDKEKQYTQVNPFLFIPLLIVAALLVAAATMAAFIYPKRHMVLRVPVSSRQLMSCAQAREAGDRETAYGHPQAKLQMGIVKEYENGEEKQKFSVDATNTASYKPSFQWLGSRAEESIEDSFWHP